MKTETTTLPMVCVRCGKETMSYVIGCFGSRNDGDVICPICLDSPVPWLGNRPKVGREFVEKWLRKLLAQDWWEKNFGSSFTLTDILIEMLREAGVEVKGECDKSSTLINKRKAIDTKGRP